MDATSVNMNAMQSDTSTKFAWEKINFPVCFYIPSFANGGAERVFVRLANYFASQGVKTRLVVNSTRGPVGNLVSKQVSVVSLNCNRTLPAIPRLADLLRREKPAAVLSALTPANLTVLMANAIAGLPSRVVVSERNHFTMLNKRAPQFKRFAIQQAVRLLYPRAYAVTGVTREVSEDIGTVAAIPQGRLHAIYNPVPDRDEIAAARSAPVPHQFFHGPDPVVVAIGRLIEQKDYKTLLNAFAKSYIARPLKLIVLGDGPDLEALKAKAADLGISDHVAFVGYQSNRLDYLVRADLFVLSSRTEGFPNALVEALACGVPSVSTDCAGGGPRDLLAVRYPDCLVPVGDAETLGNAIVRVSRANVDRDGLERLVQGFEIGGIAARYAHLIMP